jgi:hypothetical protein
MRSQFVLWASLALAMFALQPEARSADGAILVVSAADGPMPAPALEPKVRQALDEAGVAYSPAQLESLSGQVADALVRPGGPVRSTVCASGRPPCITVVRKVPVRGWDPPK